jgi:hypothetical protein
MQLAKTYSEEGLRELQADALFHLGRVLYEQAVASEDGWFDPAVDALQKSVTLVFGNSAAYFYLGKAIRAMIERKFQRRADEALRTYLAHGAPIGHEEEVRQLLAAASAGEGGA